MKSYYFIISILIIVLCFSGCSRHRNFTVRNESGRDVTEFQISNGENYQISGIKKGATVSSHRDYSFEKSWKYKVVFSDGTVVNSASGTIQGGHAIRVILTIRKDGIIKTSIPRTRRLTLR